MLTKDDHARISAAIGEVEQRTRGEIFCVLAREVSHYREVPLGWGALAALLVPPLLILPGLHRLALADIFTSWTDESVHAVEGLIIRTLTIYSLIQAGLFAVVALIVSLPRVRRVMTPRFLKRFRVNQVARRHFVAAGGRHHEPHILIFASLADRQVELVAHEAIHKAVGEGPWNAAVAAVTEGMKTGKPADGFISAIRICGDALAAHFPLEGAPRNQLPNTLLET
ncbi:MAG: TPM domain-containing protein [Alphaproteobacteria bacterium]|nr:TPM domain-containing protein [Alphaproteobacteria bacterium]